MNWRVIKLFVPFGLIIGILILFLNLAKFSKFIEKVPTQYGNIVLSILMTGLLSMIVVFVTLLVSKELETLPIILLCLGIINATAIGVITWLGLVKEVQIDLFSIMSLSLSLIAFIAILLGAIKCYSSNKYWIFRLLCVEVPFLVVCLGVLILRTLVYNQNNNEFISQFVKIIGDPPDGWFPLWDSLSNNVYANLKIAFWTGFSTGVISVQLLVGQIISLSLKILKEFNIIK